jgi:hypothetical protein
VSEEKRFCETTKGTKLPLFMIERNKKVYEADGKTYKWVPQPPTPYLQVAHRLVWFREEHPDWGVETREEKTGRDEATGIEFCIFSCRIKDAAGRIISSAHKKETSRGFEDYMEKAETGSIGRALAYCGYGTQFAASDLDEGAERPVDAPIAPAAINKPEADPRALALKEVIEMGKTRGMRRVKELTARASEVLGRDVGKTMDSISSLSLEDLTALINAWKESVAAPADAATVAAALDEHWEAGPAA